MIASLEGTIRSRETRSIVVDVGGVGYRVFVGSKLLERQAGERIFLHTHQHVSSDSVDLFGFLTQDELGLFQSLLKVNGVGPKSALTLLSVIPAETLRQAILSGDPSLLIRVPGIGKKIAERIILELSGSLAQRGSPVGDEVVDALERLGYTRREAEEALRHVHGTAGDIRERIRAALKILGKGP